MDREQLRRYAQVTLAVAAVIAAAAAGYRYLVRGGSPFGEHVVAIPTTGTIGMRPFFEFPGYPDGRSVTVYLCASATGGVEDCANLGKGTAGKRLQSKRIPKELPDTTTVDPGEYVLRAGPDETGEYPLRGEFDIIRFRVGAKPRPPSFAGLGARDLRIGEQREVAKGAPCRQPPFLADGRLVVGSTIVDPTTGVTTDLGVDGHELAWAPVGNKLAILTTDRKEIRLASSDGSNAVTKVREARGLLSSLSWSPDGERLAFISQNDPATRLGPGPPTVRILDAADGTFTSAGPGIAVAWSPQDDLLAVEMAGGLIQASDTKGKRRKLIEGRRPAWSPDAHFLTVVRSSARGQQGWVVALDGSGSAPLGGTGICAHAFSPSGTSLAVVTDREGRTTLHLRAVEIARED